MNLRYHTFDRLPCVAFRWTYGRWHVCCSIGDWPLLPVVDNYHGLHHQCWQAWGLCCGYRIQRRTAP